MASQLEISVSKERALTKIRRELKNGVVEGQETSARYLRNMLAELENLGQLVDDIFEVAQTDAGMLLAAH